MTIINDPRAKRFATVLRHYGTEHTNDGGAIDSPADARHGCDRHNECNGNLDRLAHNHYLAEPWQERRSL